MRSGRGLYAMLGCFACRLGFVLPQKTGATLMDGSDLTLSLGLVMLCAVLEYLSLCSAVKLALLFP